MTIGLVLIPWEFWTARPEKKPDRVLQAHEYVSFLQKLQAVDVNMVTGGGTCASARPTCQQNLQVFVNGLFNRLAYALASHLKYHRCFTASFLLLIFFFFPLPQNEEQLDIISDAQANLQNTIQLFRSLKQ